MVTSIVQMYYCSSCVYIPRSRGLNNAGKVPSTKLEVLSIWDIHIVDLNKINIPHLYSYFALRSCLVHKVCACVCMYVYYVKGYLLALGYSSLWKEGAALWSGKANS